MNYVVYKTTNLINGKIYIGVHKEPDINNLDSYIDNGIYKQCNANYKVKKLHNIGFPLAVYKYGYNNFKKEILYVFPGTDIGEDLAYKKEAEIVNKDFIKRKDVYNLTTGGKFSGANNNKRILQYDLDGNFIKEWGSITEVTEYLGVTGSCISTFFSKNYKMAAGYQWRYYIENYPLKIGAINIKTIYVFDLSGNLVKAAPSIRKAVEALNITEQRSNYKSVVTQIRSAINNSSRQVAGYYWSTTNKFNYNPPERTKSVAKYTKEGVFMESYISLADAARLNNLSVGNICGAIRGIHKLCGGVRWRYFYGNRNNIKPL